MKSAPNLRHLLTLQSPTTPTQDSTTGFKTPAWTTEATIHGQIEPVSGRDVLVARSFSNETSHKITIRYLQDNFDKWQILFGSRVFSIDGVITPYEIQHWQEIYATEVIK